MKTIAANNKVYKFGRKRPRVKQLRLSFKNYLKGQLPTPPATTSYWPKADSALRNIYLNDQLGDCVIAGGYHVVASETGNAGNLFTASNQQIISDYSAIGGYNPNDPNTDNGCDEETALAYWTNNGFANGTRLAGSLSVDPTNQAEIAAALWLFENLIFCIELPDAWISPFPSTDGFTWDIAGSPDPDNGHSITGIDLASGGILIDSWGMKGTLTYKAIAKYCSQSAGGSLNVVLTPDQLAKGMTKAPNGFEWADLINDFDSIGGNVSPIPTPPPTPVSPSPSPTPPSPSGVGLAQAQKWITAAFMKMPQQGMMSPKGAMSTANAALADNWYSNKKEAPHHEDQMSAKGLVQTRNAIPSDNIVEQKK
jgi:hypothetical protein